MIRKVLIVLCCLLLVSSCVKVNKKCRDNAKRIKREKIGWK